MKNKPFVPQSRGRRLKKLAELSRLVNHSAVAIIINNDPEKSILLVQRAKRCGDPWSGDMAFPGGRQEAGDADHVATACRELSEETGLYLQQPPIGKINTLWTKSHNSYRPMAVHPFVFSFPQEPFSQNHYSWVTEADEEKLNQPFSFRLSHEVTEAVWIPLALFDPANRQYFTWKTKFGKLRMPCFYYQNYKIWGLTLRMIEQLKKQQVAKL